jgi:hypothetical protein
MNAPPNNPLLTLLPFLLMSIPIIFINYFLAKEKGKNVTLWTILSIIPIVSYFCGMYLIGCANVNFDQKLDKIIKLLESKNIE